MGECRVASGGTGPAPRLADLPPATSRSVAGRRVLRIVVGRVPAGRARGGLFRNDQGARPRCLSPISTRWVLRRSRLFMGGRNRTVGSAGHRLRGRPHSSRNRPFPARRVMCPCSPVLAARLPEGAALRPQSSALRRGSRVAEDVRDRSGMGLSGSSVDCASLFSREGRTKSTSPQASLGKALGSVLGDGLPHLFAE